MAESPEAVALELTKLIITEGRSTGFLAANFKEANVLRVYQACLATVKDKDPIPDLQAEIVHAT
ncbi:hypothetical protein [Sphingomonas oligoaromativorans]|uniref:hypothetical protein n=1 Tax=Sphingomonas oligoaromativorans TaxID=575322 RepID=UPI00141E0A8F|nr:hypothetical protein [Sphingomonas oligoaromativorans]NIJ34322.1 hypothetical protein [Sphingomonas oligoaromativorans]